MHNRAIKLRGWPIINISSQNVSEPLSITEEDKNIMLKAYSMQKVGSGGKFESGNQSYGRRQIQTYEAHMVYLIKLTHQKNANLILTWECFTIAIKTIQLSSHNYYKKRGIHKGQLNLILTWKCFTIAIKTIQLSLHNYYKKKKNS